MSGLKEGLLAAPTTGKVMELQLVLARLIAPSDNPESADIAQGLRRRQGRQPLPLDTRRRQSSDAAVDRQNQSDRLS